MQRITLVPPEERLTSAWPKDATEPAWRGLAGEFAQAFDEYTEADKHAVLLQLLVAAGNVIGRRPYFPVGATRHRCSLYAILAGPTGAGRKGTAVDAVMNLLDAIDPKWPAYKSGLSTGEGLIEEVKDPPPRSRKEPRKEDKALRTPSAPGVPDRRKLVIESEFGRVLRVAKRETNTLVPILCSAWDGKSLHIMTRQTPLTATDPHISLIGHITSDELRAHLDDVNVFNGFANRFLWACVRRSKLLPDPKPLPTADHDRFQKLMGRAVVAAQRRGEVHRSKQANRLWSDGLYAALVAGRSGLFGAATDRAAPQVMRLALVYALLERASRIDRTHLESAHALWTYCEASARNLFGARGNAEYADADTILQALQMAGRDLGLTRADIYRDVFHKNKDREGITRQLQYLLDNGFARFEMVKTSGRPVERWYVV